MWGRARARTSVKTRAALENSQSKTKIYDYLTEFTVERRKS